MENIVSFRKLVFHYHCYCFITDINLMVGTFQVLFFLLILEINSSAAVWSVAD